MTTSLSFVTVDVFTSDRFAGNPLAIVNIPKDVSITQSQKQKIAKEFSLSETVFLHEAVEGKEVERKFDIFTTVDELPFAGHPTIGTLCYIGGQTSNDGGGSASKDLSLLAKAGTINAHYEYASRVASADIPHSVKVHQCTVSVEAVLVSQPQPQLAVALRGVKESAFPVVSIVKGMTYMLIEFAHESGCLELLRVGSVPIPESVHTLDDDWSPSFVAPYYYVVEPSGQPGSNSTIKIRSRMIEPEIGEDPATGSAACTLGAYLALQYGGGGQTYAFDIVQGVEMGRRSEIKVRVTLDEDGRAVKRVVLAGTAVLVTRGTIKV